MNEELFGQFLNGSLILCIVLAVLTPIMRWRRHGPAALLMALAFLAMALLIHALSKGWQQPKIVAIGAVLVILLAGDAYFRSTTDLRK